MQIGPYKLNNPLILAPMAGVTDLPFRQLCRSLGAAMAVSEMVTSDTRLWHTDKSRLRLPQESEPEPKSIQIAGSKPQQMAEAARQCADLGAQIIDINMGCPAKKVCNVLAGSSLLKDESLVGHILDAVVTAVDLPVTLKIRTGWDSNHRNGLKIAQIAEASGIQALAVHGRTRADRFKGMAEYDTIRLIKQQINIPVIANGDIDNTDKALQVLHYTCADALMIGRGAQGNPWIFQELNAALNAGQPHLRPGPEEKKWLVLNHLRAIHEYYGEYMGTRIARKHLAWYFKDRFPDFWRDVSQIESAGKQYSTTEAFLNSRINIEQSTLIIHSAQAA